MKIITEEMDTLELKLACNGYYNGNVCEATVEQLVRFYENLTFSKNGENYKIKVVLKNN